MATAQSRFRSLSSLNRTSPEDLTVPGGETGSRSTGQKNLPNAFSATGGSIQMPNLPTPPWSELPTNPTPPNANGFNDGSGYNPYLKAWMDAIGAQNGRVWTQREYDQWIGPNGYVMRGDQGGPGGRPIDPWSSGEPDQYWAYRLGTHARGDANGDNPGELGGYSGGALGSIQPGAFNMDPFVYEGPTGAGHFRFEPFQSPDPWQAPDKWVPPTLETLQTDPGYQFRLEQGQEALERSAAAKGTLLTGGTLQDIQTYAQNVATEEFDKLYQRSFGEYKNNYDESLEQYLLDYNRKFGEHQQAFQEATQQWQSATQTNRDAYQAAVNAWQMEAQRRQAQFSNLLALAGLAGS